MSALYPPGITSLNDMPYKMFKLIGQGMQNLGLLEMAEDAPSKATLRNPKRLKEWHEALVAKRNAGKSGGSISDRPIDGPSQENAAARDLIVG